MDKQSWYVRQKARLAYRRGCTLARQGNHQSAIATLSKALTAHPKIADVYIARGLSHLALEQFDRACQDFSDAINCADNPAMAYFHRMQLSHKQGKVTDADKDREQASAANAQSGAVH